MADDLAGYKDEPEITGPTGPIGACCLLPVDGCLEARRGI